MDRRMMLGSQSGDLINEYVSDGILLWLDGIRNTLDGHSSNTDKWYDLSGSNFYFPLTSSHTVNDDNVHLNNRGLWADTEYNATNIAYCEYVLQKDGTNTQSMVIRPATNTLTTLWSHSSDSFGFNHTTGDMPRFPLPTDRKLSVNSFSFPLYFNLSSATEELTKAYFNNELITTINKGSGSWTYGGNRSLFSYNTPTTYAFIGKVYAVRFYNRILTDEERTKNWNLDRLRFNII